MSDLVEKWRWLKKNNLDSWQDFQLRDIQMLVDRIEELERLVQNSTIEWASNWDLYDDVCRRKEPTP